VISCKRLSPRGGRGKNKPMTPPFPIAAALSLDGEDTKRRRLAPLVVARTPKGKGFLIVVLYLLGLNKPILRKQRQIQQVNTAIAVKIHRQHLRTPKTGSSKETQNA
jgi:hypothetical protein